MDQYTLKLVFIHLLSYTNFEWQGAFNNAYVHLLYWLIFRDVIADFELHDAMSSPCAA